MDAASSVVSVTKLCVQVHERWQDCKVLKKDLGQLDQILTCLKDSFEERLPNPQSEGRHEKRVLGGPAVSSRKLTKHPKYLTHAYFSLPLSDVLQKTVQEALEFVLQCASISKGKEVLHGPSFAKRLCPHL